MGMTHVLPQCMEWISRYMENLYDYEIVNSSESHELSTQTNFQEQKLNEQEICFGSEFRNFCLYTCKCQEAH